MCASSGSACCGQDEKGLPPTRDTLHLGCSYHLVFSHCFLSTWSAVMLKKKFAKDIGTACQKVWKQDRNDIKVKVNIPSPIPTSFLCYSLVCRDGWGLYVCFHFYIILGLDFLACHPYSISFSILNFIIILYYINYIILYCCTIFYIIFYYILFVFKCYE